MQRQDSLHDQLKTVHKLAVDAGCYDAADFLRRNIEYTEKQLAQINRKTIHDVTATPEQVEKFLKHLSTVSDELFYKIGKRLPPPFLEGWINDRKITKRAATIIERKKRESN